MSRIYSDYGTELPAQYAGLINTAARRQAILGSSRAYLQTDLRGRQRMEKVLNMGLPFNTDINKIKLEKMDLGSRPLYSAPKPQPWGTWSGGLGSTQSAGGYKEEEPIKKNNSEKSPAPKGYIRNRYGNLEPEEWYTKDTQSGSLRKKTEQEYRGSKNIPKISQPNNSWNMNLLGGFPKL